MGCLARLVFITLGWTALTVWNHNFRLESCFPDVLSSMELWTNTVREKFWQKFGHRVVFKQTLSGTFVVALISNENFSECSVVLFFVTPQTKTSIKLIVHLFIQKKSISVKTKNRNFNSVYFTCNRQSETAFIATNVCGCAKKVWFTSPSPKTLWNMSTLNLTKQKLSENWEFKLNSSTRLGCQLHTSIISKYSLHFFWKFANSICLFFGVLGDTKTVSWLFTQCKSRTENHKLTLPLTGMRESEKALLGFVIRVSVVYIQK